MMLIDDEDPADRHERFADLVIHIAGTVIIIAIIGIALVEGARAWG